MVKVKLGMVETEKTGASLYYSNQEKRSSFDNEGWTKNLKENGHDFSLKQERELNGGNSCQEKIFLMTKLGE